MAGYVRSYARYLRLDPEWAFRAFCAEANFETAHGMSTASSRRQEQRVIDADRSDIFANSPINFSPKGESLLARIEPGAVGSTVVLLALIGLIGYGGFAVLKEVQQVDVVPVERTPEVVATLDPVNAAVAPPGSGGAGSGVTAKDPDAVDRLYRPQALEVPVMVPRDGPIATLDPSAVGALVPGAASGPRRSATTLPRQGEAPAADTPAGPSTTTGAAGVAGTGAPDDGMPRVVADTAPEVVMLAVRPSWVRVRAADGTVIYEKIMQPGEAFTLPRTEDPATLRTGESGAIYFAVNDQTYGPVGQSGQVTSNLSLAATNLTETYDVADMTRDADLERYVAELQLGPDSGTE